MDQSGSSNMARKWISMVQVVNGSRKIKFSYQAAPTWCRLLSSQARAIFALIFRSRCRNKALESCVVYNLVRCFKINMRFFFVHASLMPYQYNWKLVTHTRSLKNTINVMFFRPHYLHEHVHVKGTDETRSCFCEGLANYKKLYWWKTCFPLPSP